jgi:hypothetical protein
MIKVWDNYNKKWLKLTEICFTPEGEVWRICAMELDHTDVLSQGWWDFKGDDLKHIAIMDYIEYNSHLII